jgi:microcystin-dependent protein
MKTTQTIMLSVLLISTLFWSSASLANASPFLGEIQYSGTSFCPVGWVPAEGQLLEINQHQSLYSLLGTTFGGNGRTTFALPDYRGRVAIGADSQNPLGSKGGAETIFLSSQNIPSHTHTATTKTAVKASSQGGKVASPDMAILADDGNDKIYASGIADITMAAGALSSVTMVNPTANIPIDNMQAYQVITACIAMRGTFPSRN